MWIKNRTQLLSHGNVQQRKAVLDIIEAGLDAGDPYMNATKLLRIEDGSLIIGHKDVERRGKSYLSYDLSDVGNIYVVGGGKAAQRIAKGIEDVLGDRIAGGAISAKKGEGKYLKHIEVTLASHPIPDEKSIIGAKRIIEIAQKAQKGDLVFCVSSGGISSLVTLPAPGLTLDDIQDVTRVMQQEHGVPTRDLNVVRGHLSSVKLGRVAALIHPATMIGFLLGSWLGPLAYDERTHSAYIFHPGSHTTTFQDAIDRINKWGVWKKLPPRVKAHLETGNPCYEAPKSNLFDEMDIHQFGVMNTRIMVEGARKKAEELGFTTILFPRIGVTVEARELGNVLSELALQSEGADPTILGSGTPFTPPCILLSSGESIVTVGTSAATARGGRNQEFALAAALRIRGSTRITVAAVDSDGTDGPTNVAGGLVDGYSATRAENMGIDIFKALRTHNSTTALMKLNDAIITGHTGMNLMDLRVISISEKRS
jgi:glycerate-2-kinase